MSSSGTSRAKTIESFTTGSFTGSISRRLYRFKYKNADASPVVVSVKPSSAGCTVLPLVCVVAISLRLSPSSSADGRGGSPAPFCASRQGPSHGGSGGLRGNEQSEGCDGSRASKKHSSMLQSGSQLPSERRTALHPFSMHSMCCQSIAGSHSRVVVSAYSATSFSRCSSVAPTGAVRGEHEKTHPSSSSNTA